MTQKELILAWGGGESGHMEQLNDLTMDELILTYRQLKTIARTTQPPNIQANLAFVIRAVRQHVQQGTRMFFLACKGGYPYQESSNYGTSKIDVTMLSVRLYPTYKDAQSAAEIVNRRTNSLGEKTGRTPGDIVYVKTLGNAGNMDAVNQLERMGVNAVCFGEKKDEKTDLNLRAETLVRRSNSSGTTCNFFDVAPKTYAMLSIIVQAENENRPKEEIISYRSRAFQLAASGKIGVAISKQDYENGVCQPFTYVVDETEYLELFTDWASMTECLGEDKQAFMAVGNWDNIISFGKPVMLNRSATMPFEAVYQIGCFTDAGRMAMAFIADSYQLDVTTDDGFERCQNILNDIRAAKPVCSEFYAGLSMATRSGANGESENYVVFAFPENNPVTVNGHTAKQFFDNKLCSTSAASYHVLAVLHNDTDGSAQRAFENAELYE